MKFEVTFTTGEQESNIALEPVASFGLDMADIIIEEVRKNNTFTNEVNTSHVCIPNCPIIDHRHSAWLSEEAARESNKFNCTTHITVTVPPLSFDRFWKFDWSIRTNTIKSAFRTKKQLDQIYTYFEINGDLIYEQWKRDGFPLDWRL